MYYTNPRSFMHSTLNVYIMKKTVIYCWKIIKQYLCNSGIHGLRYLAGDEFSYPERLFWLVACCVCWWGCSYMVTGVITDFRENPVAVTIETTYLDWQTPFPSISVCFTTDFFIKKKFFRMKPSQFSATSMQPSLKKSTSEEMEKIFEDYFKLPCSEILRECWWNKQKINCCEVFQPLYKTGLGHCLIFNSIHSDMGIQEVKYFVNRTVILADFVVDIFADDATLGKEFEAYILDNSELPLLTTDDSRKIIPKRHTTGYIPFILQCTTNQKGVKSVRINRRNCRFQDELIDNSVFDVYTADSCYLQVMLEEMVKSCGCVHLLYHAPPGVSVCNYTGTLCLFKNKGFLQRNITAGRCLPDCEKTDIYTSKFKFLDPAPENISRLHFSLLSHPKRRYWRYVSRDMLSVIITVGGAVGLFMGASILSLFEIPYWLFVRRDRIS